MSQIDKLIFVPLLVWFCLIMCIIYIFIFTYFLGFFFRILKIRKTFLTILVKQAVNIFYFFEIFSTAFDSSFVNIIFNNIYLNNNTVFNKWKKIY